MYLRSSIQKKKNLFIASVSWSWFGIQHWEEFEIFESQHEAELWILNQRTGGTLVYNVDENEEKK